MTATAQKQITVTGTELSKLSAAMLTVASNTVTAVTPNADGTSAVVTLGTDLVPETNTKVTATVDGTATDYTVKYTIKAVTVAVQAGTYDDDKAGQALTVLVDGVATTPSYLVAQGYTVTFNAWDKNGTVANTTLFGAATSTTGDIKVPQATEADYTAQVTIAKGSTVISSTKATIKIRDLDNNANAISSYVLKNTTNAATTQQFTMSSSSLVVSEKATFTKVVVGYGDAAAELTTGYTVESSNTAVISVDSTTGQMTANGLGTADITITVGAATKVVPLTVVGTKRVVTTATPATATLTSIKNAGAQTMTVAFKDQYGDPIVGTLTTANLVKFTATSISGVALNTSPLTFTNFTTAAKGEQTVSFTNTTATAGSTGVVVFRDANDVVIGSFNIVTSDVNNQTIKKVEIDTDAANSSKDDTIDTDLTSDKKITYKVSLFNSDGVANGSVTNLAGYTVTFNKDIVNVRGDVNATPSTTGSYTLGTNDTRIIVTGLKAGTTTMEIRDNGNQVIDTRTVTVLKGVPYVTGITYKSTSAINYASTVKYTNVVDVQEMSNDDIVNGVTLSVASVYKIRIDELGTFPGSGTTTVGAKGNLYLDKDDSGRYNEGDIKLAELTISNSVTSGSSAWDTAVTNSIDGRAVTAGNVGTITFTLTDTVTSTLPIVNTAPISINVPQSAAQSAAEAAVTKWENEVNAIDNNTKLAAALADTAGNKAAATTAIAALPGADQAPYTARVTAAQTKATAGNTLKTAVDTFVALPVASDANITTAVTGITTVGTAVTTATTAGVPTAYINGADVATKIATKTTAINAARTIDTTQTTITATALANATVGTNSTAVVVPKNAAGVTLSTCLTGAYAVTYNWTVTSATPFTSAVLTNGTTDTATITITTANLTVTPVGLQCVISQGSAATVTKTANMVVTGL